MPTVAFGSVTGVMEIVGHAGVSVKLREPGQEFASVAVMVKVAAVVLVGVPVMAPVLVFKVRPAGSVPLVTAYTYGAVPALAAALDEYGVPTVSEAFSVANVSTGQIFNANVRVPLQPRESVAGKVSEVPAPLLVVGVPLITPVEALKLKPEGSVPVVSASV